MASGAALLVGCGTSGRTSAVASGPATRAATSSAIAPPAPGAPAATAASAASTSVGPSTTAGAPGGPVASQAPAPVESNPVGDIPDTVGFVTFADPKGAFEVKHPDGWAQAPGASGASFTDKLDSITVAVTAASGPVTPASFRTGELAALQASEPAFALSSVEATTLPAGVGVLVRYQRNSAPDPVTTKQHRDEVLRYEVVSGGRRAVLELADPVGADNVDAFRTVAQSLRLR